MTESPAPATAAKKSKQQQEWERQATQLKADGYTGGVVARKMIQIHGMPEAAATALVSSLFGKTVDARGGDTSTAIMMGLVLAGAGFGGAALLFSMLGLAFLKVTIFIYLALLGLGAKGLTQAIIAWVNAGVKEDLTRR